MSPRVRRNGRIVFLLIGSFYAGAIAGWLLHASFSPSPSPSPTPASPDSIAATGEADLGTTAPEVREEPAALAKDPAIATDPIAELKRRDLRLPVEGATVAALEGQFDQRRGGGSRGHEAVDILAPRHAPVHAADDGTIAKLFNSAAGGITIYQFDPTETFCYYYAHLERYASGLEEGQRVRRGDVIGYVGTSGNAPPNTPHLHFAVLELTPEKKWSEGRPLDPYAVFSGR